MKSRVLILIIFIATLICVIPANAQEVVDESIVTSYDWPEGKYQWVYINGEKAHIQNDPSTTFTFNAAHDVVVTFWVAENPQIELTSHSLSKDMSEDGIPIGVSDVFLNDEKIVSLVLVTNAVAGDTAQWVFRGPTPKLEYTGSFSTGGDTGMIVEVDLSQFPLEEVVGPWTISVSLNEVPVSTLSVLVEERQLGGFVWWEGLVGVVVIAAIGVAVYFVSKGRKTPRDDPLPVNSPPAETAQHFCGDRKKG